MNSYRLSATAEEQIAKILAESTYDHGRDRAENYAMLIASAIEDIALDPRRLGTRPVSQARGVWVYELWSSRFRLPPGRRVRDPWHKVVYRVTADDVVEILAIVGRSYPSERAAQRWNNLVEWLVTSANGFPHQCDPASSRIGRGFSVHPKSRR